MTPPLHRQLIAIRNWLSAQLADIGTWFYDLAATVDPGPQGDPCPDCGVPTTVPLDKPCPECEMRREDQKREDAVYGSGFEDGWRSGVAEEAERHG